MCTDAPVSMCASEVLVLMYVLMSLYSYMYLVPVIYVDWCPYSVGKS